MRTKCSRTRSLGQPTRWKLLIKSWGTVFLPTNWKNLLSILRDPSSKRYSSSSSVWSVQTCWRTSRHALTVKLSSVDHAYNNGSLVTASAPYASRNSRRWRYQGRCAMFSTCVSLTVRTDAGRSSVMRIVRGTFRRVTSALNNKNVPFVKWISVRCRTDWHGMSGMNVKVNSYYVQIAIWTYTKCTTTCSSCSRTRAMSVLVTWGALSAYTNVYDS